MSCKKECGGCSCHINPPCTHCIEDHDNIDNHPECPNCGEIFYDMSEIDIRWHLIKEFELV